MYHCQRGLVDSLFGNNGSRPSTSSSETSNMTSMSERSTMSFSNQGHKDDGPSPLGVPSGISTSSSERRHDRQDSMSRPLLSPSVAVDLGHSLSSSQSPYPRAASLFHPSRGNLEVPPLSSSLPTQMDVHHMKERSISYDGAKSLANKSTSSSDPGTHLTGDIQAAITDHESSSI